MVYQLFVKANFLIISILEWDVYSLYSKPIRAIATHIIATLWYFFEDIVSCIVDRPKSFFHCHQQTIQGDPVD